MSNQPDAAAATACINLWGLVFCRGDLPPGELSHKTFYMRSAGHSGVLTFASAIDAEIYCRQLETSGMRGWQRAPLESIDIDRVMSALPAAQRKLMLALGFFASDTNDLLLDDDKTLITPLLPVSYVMRHCLHGLSQLHIHAEVFQFVEQWWRQVGGESYPDQVRDTAGWTDSQLAGCAGEALSKAAVADLRQYNALWNDTGSGDECAVFSPETGAWQFSTLRGQRRRQLH